MHNRLFPFHASPRFLRILATLAVSLCLLTASSTTAAAQEAEEAEVAEDDTGWSNETELSLVVTQGNSDTQTFGFKSALKRQWERAEYSLRLESVRSDTADDRYAIVDPDNEEDFILIEPSPTLDVDKALVLNEYHRKITHR